MFAFLFNRVKDILHNNNTTQQNQTNCSIVRYLADPFEYSMFKVLPRDLQLEVFSWLNLDDIATVRLVNKAWNYLTKHEFVWRSLYNRNFGADRVFETDVDRL